MLISSKLRLIQLSRNKKLNINSRLSIYTRIRMLDSRFSRIRKYNISLWLLNNQYTKTNLLTYNNKN